MNRIRTKLRSRRGASITFALLLFLVCAVVSSVVVVAGSAAAGRMSQMTTMDQRYYAVTSAAELLCGVFDGKTVQVTTARTGEDEGTVPAETDAILAHASKQLVKLLSTGGAEETSPVNFTLSAEKNGLGCTVRETVGRNGLLAFEVTSGDGTAAASYTLRVVFASDVRRDAADSSATQTTTQVTWKLNSIRRGGAGA